jgi:1-acyl-sn-glycerol-3-phosphate acyltransferase
MKAPPALKKIDVENVFKSKNPGLYKLLPGFLFKLLRRIIHEDVINDFLQKNGNEKDADFAKKTLEYFNISVEPKGLENLPASGGCIIVANHPIGGLDAMALIVAVSRKRSDIKFLVNDILMNLENLQGIFVPVNKHGKNPSHFLKEIDKLYASEQVILIFPAGLVSRKRNRKIMDLEWKKSFITRARKYDKTIIPAFISGRNTNFFYNIGNIRKTFGIKTNIEMLFLPNETFYHRDTTITLIFGEPIRVSQINSQESDQILADKIRQQVYQMGQAGKPLHFQG